MLQENFYTGEDVSAVVFDLGSHSIRAGYGGLHETPNFVFPSVLGYASQPESSDRKLYFGTTKLNAVPVDSGEYVQIIKNGKIYNWEAFESAFDILMKNFIKADPSTTPIFFSEHSVYDQKQRDKIAELMFEKFNTKAIAIWPNAPLALLSKEKISGAVIDVGASGTTISCVYQLYMLRKSIQTSNLGGDYLAQAAKDLLTELNLKVPYKPTGNKSVDEIKEKKTLNTIAMELLEFNPYEFDHKIDKKHPGLPDVDYEIDRVIQKFTGPQRSRACEGFFDLKYLPEKYHEGAVTLPDMIMRAIDNIDVDIKRKCCSSFMTTGGVSETPGFIAKLRNMKMSHRLHYAVNAYTGAHHLPSLDAWKGASVLVGTGSFQQLWFSKEQYTNSTKREQLYHY